MKKQFEEKMFEVVVSAQKIVEDFYENLQNTGVEVSDDSKSENAFLTSIYNYDDQSEGYVFIQRNDDLKAYVITRYTVVPYVTADLTLNDWVKKHKLVQWEELKEQYQKEIKEATLIFEFSHIMLFDDWTLASYEEYPDKKWIYNEEVKKSYTFKKMYRPYEYAYRTVNSSSLIHKVFKRKDQLKLWSESNFIVDIRGQRHAVYLQKAITDIARNVGDFVRNWNQKLVAPIYMNQHALVSKDNAEITIHIARKKKNGTKFLFVENTRIVINSDGTSVYLRKNLAGLSKLRANTTLIAWDVDAIDDYTFDEKLFEGTSLEYGIKFVNSLEMRNKLTVLNWLIKFPQMESVLKISEEGFANLQSELNCTKTLIAVNYNLFGQVNEDETSAAKYLGLSSPQLREIIDRKLLFSGFIRFLKEMVAERSVRYESKILDVSTLSSNMFNELMELFLSGFYPDSATRLVLSLGLKRTVSTIKLMTDNYELSRARVSYEQHLHKLHDTLRVIYRIQCMDEDLADELLKGLTYTQIRHFDDRHDAMVEIMNAMLVEKSLTEKELISSEQRKNLENLSKLSFNDDEKFEVVAPTRPNDIVIEGMSLNHCVASYVRQVLSGSVSIMFIRRKDKATSPFFTMEIQKNQIKQVKGSSNKLPDDQDLLNFIDKYAKEKSLKIKNF